MSIGWKQRWNSVRVVVLALAVMAMPAGAVRAQEAVGAKTKRLFWKITSPTTEVYFLGSIHVATEDFYPLPAEIEAAFAKAGVLVVEADASKAQAEMAMKLLQEGLYAPGDSLDKHISPETMKAFLAFCNDDALPPVMAGMMKPVMAAMTVESVMVQKLGMKPELGIDMHFLTQANTAKKKIQELESMDEQFKLLMSLDDKVADKWLADTMKENSATEVEKIIKAWKAGDAKAIEALMLEDDKRDADAAKVSEVLLYKRNDEMVKKIEALLKGTEKGFVVVGAAHLIGDRGVLKQLEKGGYKVEVPELTVPAAAAPAAK